MDERFLQELVRFQRTAVQLQEAVTAAQKRLPEEGTGSDSQHAVTVRVSKNGVPQRITAARDWQRRCRPESLADAVVEASTAAALELISTWSQRVTQSGWDLRAGDLDHASPSGIGAQPGLTDDPRESGWQRVVPRPLNELAEEVIDALTVDDSPDVNPQEAKSATGRDPGRHVSITLSSGSLSCCEVDAAWASRQASTGLNRAFAGALTDARCSLKQADTTDANADHQRRLRALLDEAMATLTDPRRIAGT